MAGPVGGQNTSRAGHTIINGTAARERAAGPAWSPTPPKRKEPLKRPTARATKQPCLAVRFRPDDRSLGGDTPIETRWEYDQAMAVPSSAQVARESIGLSAVSSQEWLARPGARRSNNFLRRPCRLNDRHRGPPITSVAGGLAHDGSEPSGGQSFLNPVLAIPGTTQASVLA
jgi:hypothetical protein